MKSTHHAFEDGDLLVSVWNHAVASCLPAVQQRLFGLGPPDVRRPPDAGQQTRGTTHRVVTGPGRLLVPGFDWIAGDEQRHCDAHHGKPDWPLHVWTRLGTFFTQRTQGAFLVCSQPEVDWMFCWVFGKLSAAYIGWLGGRYRDPGGSSNQNRGGWMMILCVCVCVW